MKPIAERKLFEQHGEELPRAEIRERQRAIALAYLAGMQAHATKEACPYETEDLAGSWNIGRREAEARATGKMFEEL